jgi:hypothetical protein
VKQKNGVASWSRVQQAAILPESTSIYENSEKSKFLAYPAPSRASVNWIMRKQYKRDVGKNLPVNERDGVLQASE